MDLASQCLLGLLTPITIYVASLTTYSLWTSLIVVNPITVILIVTILKRFGSPAGQATSSSSSSSSVQLRLIKRERVNGAQASPIRTYCCDSHEDKAYSYYRCWIVSAHISLLFSIHNTLVSNLQISFAELSLLYFSYLILLGLIINLRRKIANVLERIDLSSSSPAANLTATTSLRESKQPEVSQQQQQLACNGKACDGICYMKMLVYPIMGQASTFVTGTYIEEDRTSHLESSSSASDTQTMANVNDSDSSTITSARIFEQTNRQLGSEKMIRRIAEFNSPKSDSATGGSYLILCNVLHLFILLQYIYLFLTYSCATIPSKFGLAIIMPYDCTYIFDDNNDQARRSIFCAILTLQVLLSQVALFCRSLLLV